MFYEENKQFEYKGKNHSKNKSSRSKLIKRKKSNKSKIASTAQNENETLNKEILDFDNKFSKREFIVELPSS